jgi:hypothetical protein
MSHAGSTAGNGRRWTSPSELLAWAQLATGYSRARARELDRRGEPPANGKRCFADLTIGGRSLCATAFSRIRVPDPYAANSVRQDRRRCLRASAHADGQNARFAHQRDTVRRGVLVLGERRHPGNPRSLSCRSKRRDRPSQNEIADWIPRP